MKKRANKIKLFLVYFWKTIDNKISIQNHIITFLNPTKRASALVPRKRKLLFTMMNNQNTKRIKLSDQEIKEKIFNFASGGKENTTITNNKVLQEQNAVHFSALNNSIANNTSWADKYELDFSSSTTLSCRSSDQKIPRNKL